MKRKKQFCIIILFLLVCGIGVGSFVIWMKQKESTKEKKIAVKENQSLIVAQINTINGNEITFAEAEEVDLTSMKGGGARGNKEGAESGENQNGNSDSKSQISEGENSSSEDAVNGQQMPRQGSMGSTKGQFDGNTLDGNMPDGGTRPNGDASGGNMPDGGAEPDGNTLSGNMPKGGGMPEEKETAHSRTGDEMQESSDEEEKTKNRTMYQVTGEEQTMLIPVGTAVTTQFGTTTTFSRLAAGDMVKILLEKNENNENVIVGIWMVQ